MKLPPYEIFTLVDLSPANVNWANEHFTQLALNAHAEVGDIRDLSRFAAESFDAALVLGPLYHLTRESDRKLALAEVRRVLRKQSTIFSMMLSHAAAIYEGFNRWPEGIFERESVQQLLKTGSGFNFERDPHDFEGVYYAHPSTIVPLHEGAGFQKLVLAGCEGILGGRREVMENLEPGLQQAWIELMLQICEDPTILGASERLLFVGRAS